MKKIVWILFLYFAHVQLSWAQPAELNGKIKFAWGDEFNGTSINTNIWKVKNNSDNWATKEQSVELARNVSVGGGFLMCEVKKENYPCPDSNNYDCYYQRTHTGYVYKYTAGSVESKQMYNQQYGYAEAVIRFNPKPGFWAAFWTYAGEGLPVTRNAAEVDIMERVPDANSYTITTNIHLGYCPDGSPQCQKGLGAYCDAFPACDGEEHILSQDVSNSTKYALYWSPTELVFYINDVAKRRMKNPGVVDPLKFILGMGVLHEKVSSSTIFPSTFFVDYIHVYSLYDCLNNTTVAIGEVVNKKVTQVIDTIVGCTTINGNGTTGGKMSVVAKRSIALLSNFSVKQGGSLEARISPTLTKNTSDDLPNPEQYIHYNRFQGYQSKQVEVENAEVAKDAFTVSPNPIADIASVNYTISKQGAVKITLYNMMGIVEEELVNAYQPAGDHTYTLNGLNYKAGVYSLVFESNGTRQNRTVVIAK